MSSDAIVNLGFIGLVFVLYALLLVGVSKAIDRSGSQIRDRRKVFLAAALGMFFWLLLTAVLGMRGYFADFEAMPPRVLLSVLVMLVTIGVLARSQTFGTLLDHTPGKWIVGLQSFRIVMEIILWALAEQRMIPHMMTWEGRNWDIITGVTASVVAWLCFNGGIRRRQLLLWWNVLGIALLFNVVTRGMLAAPTPFRQIITDPPTFLVGYFPWNWLPAFVVPVAFFLHMASLRQLVRKKA